MVSRSNRVEANFQWQTVKTMVGPPRSHKNSKRKITDGLHLGSIHSRGMSKNDDRAVGNEKRRSIWKRRRNKTTNKKRKSSNESLRLAQATRESKTKQ